MRGTFSALPLRVQEQSAWGTSTRGCPVKQGSVSWPFSGSIWSSSSAGMAWVLLALSQARLWAWEPAQAPSHSPHCGQLCIAVAALLPGRLLGPPVCLLDISSDKLNPGSCTAACQPGPYDWAIPLGQTGAPILLLPFPCRLSLRAHPCQTVRQRVRTGGRNACIFPRSCYQEGESD